MRIEDRPKKRFLSDSSRVGLLLVAFWTAICIMFGFLLWAVTDEIPDEEYGMHPEPIQTVFEDDVEIITEEVSFGQEAPLTDESILAHLCMAEAGNQPLVGKIAVVVTVLNRADAWGMSVYEVATQKNQYAYPYYGIVDEECYKAVEIAYEAFAAEVFPRDMFYFRTSHYHKYGEPYAIIGDHYFSCEGGEDK